MKTDEIGGLGVFKYLKSKKTKADNASVVGHYMKRSQKRR